MNRQPWRFSVIQDVEQVGTDAKAKRYADMLRNEAFNVFYDASTVIVIGADERGTYTEADCWLAAENLMLAACDRSQSTIGSAAASRRSRRTARS